MPILPRIPEQCRLNSIDETRMLDHQTIQEFGIDGFTLMEIAGSGAAGYIKSWQGTEKKGLFLCGKGNNAGDALVVARYLADKAGHRACIVFVLGDDDLAPDTAHNLELLKKLDPNEQKISFITQFDGIDLQSYDYIVDGLFGTGLHSELRKPIPNIIEKINASGLSVYSMDVPSGLNADAGTICNTCIKADHTFTFGTNKIGFYLGEATSYTGEIHFISLPFPSRLNKSTTYLLNDELNNAFPDAVRIAKHKYENGAVHILAGSEGLSGAAVMAARSAWRTGAGSVILYAPKKLIPVYEKNLPQIIKVAVGSKNDGHFKKGHAGQIIKKLNGKNGVLIAGPGIGTDPSTGECIFDILDNYDGQTVLDADAFAFWEQINTLPQKKKNNWLLTPHIGEAKTYLGADFTTDNERLHWTAGLAHTHSCSILMKGNPSIFASEKTRIITGYDTSMFSRAGFGDVLAGSLGTYLAITNKPVLSCVKALYNGYLSYKNHQTNQPFGPEHLI